MTRPALSISPWLRLVLQMASLFGPGGRACQNCPSTYFKPLYLHFYSTRLLMF
jgi:hypothetical protein